MTFRRQASHGGARAGLVAPFSRSKIVAMAMFACATIAVAGPEEDRQKLLSDYKGRFPDIRVEEYVHGALAFDPDAKAQYLSIMEFPPYSAEIEQGARLWRAPFKNGKTYADCLPNGGKMIAGDYPMFDEYKGRVVTFEDRLNDCRVINGEEPYALGDMPTMGRLSAYARGLSDGMRMNVKVQGQAALKAYEDGKKTYYARVGQLNFSCASCHVDNVGNRLRAELLSMAIGQATHWPVFRAGADPTTLQARYELCYTLMRHIPESLGSERMNNLEYFHAYMSNGLEMRASVFRK
jgi:L-cysteine S-thiosulfotransferase